jgi:Ca2+-binding EF-hand superfamily protein
MATEQEQLVTGIGNYLQKNYGDRSLDAMRKLFDRYDVNHDGKIDKQELGQLLKDVDIGNTFTRSAWVRGIIDKLDTDADKAISWDEFKSVASAS